MSWNTKNCFFVYTWKLCHECTNVHLLRKGGWEDWPHQTKVCELLSHKSKDLRECGNCFFVYAWKLCHKCTNVHLLWKGGWEAWPNRRRRETVRASEDDLSLTHDGNRGDCGVSHKTSPARDDLSIAHRFICGKRAIARKNPVRDERKPQADESLPNFCSTSQKSGGNYRFLFVFICNLW